MNQKYPQNLKNDQNTPQSLQNDQKIIHEFHKNLFMTKLIGLCALLTRKRKGVAMVHGVFGWFNDYIVGGICSFIFEGFNEVNSQPIRVDGDRNFWRRLL